MCLSLDDYEQNHELMRNGETFAKELVKLIHEKYQDQKREYRYKSLIGIEKSYNELTVSTRLVHKMENLIIERDESGKYDSIKKLYQMIEELFELIKEQYGNDPEKLQTLIDVLKDDDGRDEFMFTLHHQL
jgi:hypothetical protein